MKTLYIVRGIPGSGKSTLAAKLADKPENICEADQYFMDKEGRYNFKPSEIRLAHEFCFDKVKSRLERGEEIVVVANTFCRRWEYIKYMVLAIDFGYDKTVIECHGRFDNVHGVPKSVIKRMEENFECTTYGS